MGGLISLREAATISGYHQDYLSFLIRKNKLNGKKIGRSWCVREEELRDFLAKKNAGEIIDNEKSDFNNKPINFVCLIKKLIPAVFLLFILFFLIIFQFINNKKIENNEELKNGYVVSTIYSESVSEVSSQTTTKTKL
ncbi:MAG: hypothetical protein ACD_72C00487G0001 [uncultured bacterium]|nr:MAG: hypothetical protein ACD_72C00487G0001 [uncultured bacterium]